MAEQSPLKYRQCDYCGRRDYSEEATSADASYYCLTPLANERHCWGTMRIPVSAGEKP